MLLDESKPGPRLLSMDNMTMNNGKLYICEDRGGDSSLSPLISHDLATGLVEEVANHNPNYFHPDGASFLTVNEESSGIIPLDAILGPGWFAIDVQAHANSHLPAGAVRRSSGRRAGPAHAHRGECRR